MQRNIQGLICLLGAGLALSLLLAPSSARANAPMSACPEWPQMAPDSMPALGCESYLIGMAHGLDAAMRQFGYNNFFCLTEKESSPAVLYNQIANAMQSRAAQMPDEKLFIGALNVLMDTYPCAGDQPNPGFRSPPTGNILAWCKHAVETDTEAGSCSSYMFGLSSSLLVTPGAQGANQWACFPRSGVSSRILMTLLIDGAIDDASLQEIPIAEAAARVLARQFSC